MNSSALIDLAPFETERSEAFETNDLVDGDFGIGFAFDDIFRSFASPFCFFVGESLLLKVKVLLRGRSRLVELSEPGRSDASLSSSIDPSRD